MTESTGAGSVTFEPFHTRVYLCAGRTSPPTPLRRGEGSALRADLLPSPRRRGVGGEVLPAHLATLVPSLPALTRPQRIPILAHVAELDLLIAADHLG